MNRNALTEQRRETVIGLLKGMNIKKSAVGGFDKDDVYDCMQQLCDLYEKSIEELENAYEAEINVLKDRYQKYDDNNELYVSLIMEAKKSSNEIISQAKTEVETILAEGREQVAQQEKEIEQMRIGMDVEKRAMTDELNASRKAVEAEKKAMKAEVDAEREKMTAMKNKYTQQIKAMEEEFEEIKTNILRTAGKIDSLKSKLPNDDDITWNMMNDLDAVDFPTEEIHVEDTYAPAQVEAAAVEPAVTIVPSFETPQAVEVAEAVASIEEAPAFTLEDLTAPLDPVAEVPVAEAPVVEAPVQTDGVEELTFEDLEIELPEIVAEAPEPEKKEAPVEEISFEGLEDLFKEN